MSPLRHFRSLARRRSQLIGAAVVTIVACSSDRASGPGPLPAGTFALRISGIASRDVTGHARYSTDLANSGIGAAFTMRINEVPASSGYGEPLAKFFRLGDQAKIVNAITCDRRFVVDKVKPPTKDDPPGPYLLVITAQGMSLRDSRDTQ